MIDKQCTLLFIEMVKQFAIPEIHAQIMEVQQIADVWPTLPPEIRQGLFKEAEDILLPEVLIGMANETRKASGLPEFMKSECSWENCTECKHRKHSTCTANLPWPDGTPENPPCFTFSDELIAALEERDSLRNELGDDHPKTTDAMIKAMCLFPPHIKKMMHAKMAEFGTPMPTPCGYSDDGEPVFSIVDAAATLGVSPDEAEEKFREMLAERAAHGLDDSSLIADPSKIHRIQ